MQRGYVYMILQSLRPRLFLQWADLKLVYSSVYQIPRVAGCDVLHRSSHVGSPKRSLGVLMYHPIVAERVMWYLLGTLLDLDEHLGQNF
jgi:hypothetical protein